MLIAVIANEGQLLQAKRNAVGQTNRSGIYITAQDRLAESHLWQFWMQ
jgi:hypothetical protein